MTAPSFREEEIHIFPRALKWRRQAVGTKNDAHNVISCRDFLTRLRFTQVNWHPWVTNGDVTEIGLARQMTGERILLEGPSVLEWYLGERVAPQTDLEDRLLVPQDPPSCMRSAQNLEDEDLINALNGIPSASFTLFEENYDVFRVTHLMPNFPLSDDPQVFHDFFISDRMLALSYFSSSFAGEFFCGWPWSTSTSHSSL